LPLGRFVLSIIRLRRPFERHRHAKRYSFLSFAYLPFLFEPTAISVEWAGLQVAPNALFERKQSIPEAKCVLPSYVNSDQKDEGDASLPDLELT